MTNEELQQELQDLSEGLDKLPDSDKPLSKEDRNRQHFLSLKKEALLRIKQAKEKKDLNQEIKCNMDYALLTEFGEKHPLLLHLARIRLRGHIF